MEVQRAAPPARRRRADARAVVGAAVVLLVLVLASLAARGPGWSATAPTARATPTASTGSAARTNTQDRPPASRPPERESFSLPRWRPPSAVVVVVLLLAGVALLAGTVTFVRLPRRDRRGMHPSTGAPQEEPVPDRRPLAAAAVRALAQVEQPDAREAVIRSWLLLGEAAAAAGVPARPAETATEYAARVAAEFYVPGPELTRLAALYREARFSAHQVGGRQRAEARTLLEQLSAALGHGRR